MKDRSRSRQTPPTAHPRRGARARALASAAGRQRDMLRERLLSEATTPELREVVEAHFRHMPDRYWTRVNAAVARWHLEALLDFYRRLDADGPRVLAPVVRWRHFPDRSLSEVVVCTWDRPGLLAEVARAFAESGIGILQADIYPRTDNVVLDVFQVADRQFEFIPRERLLEETVKRLETLTVPGPARRISPVARGTEAHRARKVLRAGNVPVWVEWELGSSPDYAILMIEAPDQLDRLHIVLREIAATGLSVAQAVVAAQHGAAADALFLIDSEGRKPTDAALLNALRARLRRALRTAT